MKSLTFCRCFYITLLNLMISKTVNFWAHDSQQSCAADSLSLVYFCLLHSKRATEVALQLSDIFLLPGVPAILQSGDGLCRT